MGYDNLKTTIQKAYDQIKATPGFRERWAQKQMIGLLAREFGHSSESYSPMCVVEAGTGTGKTYGYCLPLIPVAQASDKKLVISTATVALQEQLFNTDLPALRKTSGLDFTYALAKGRRRYICPLKLTNTASFAQMAIFDQTDISQEAVKFAKLIDNGWSGDFDELDFTVSEQVKTAFTTDSAGCIRSRCTHFEACPFMNAKKRMMSSDVIVANHALLISDFNIADTGGIALPVASECFHVIDEAHHLPREVLAHTAFSHTVHGATTWIESIIKFAEGIGSKGDLEFKESIGFNDLDTNLISDAQALKERLSLLYATLASDEAYRPSEQERLNASRFKRQGDPHVTRFVGGLIPDWLTEIGQSIHSAGAQVSNHLSSMKECLDEAVDRSAEDLITSLSEIGFLIDRTSNLVSTWSLMLEDKETHPHAKWIEYREKGDAIDFLVSSSATEAASFLNKTLFAQSCGVVMTSATLTALGSFDHYLKETGLCEEDTKLLRLQSPFDYQGKAMLHIPVDMVEPSDAVAHTQGIIQWAKDNINPNESTLMLFTSTKQMREVADALKVDHAILMQGEQPKSVLIDEHKSRCDDGLGSILVGLDSFGEGLNLPGKYCTHVVIAKLPFPVPSSPVEKSQAEYVESIGGNSFMEISVPQASKKLTQWCGRLLRTEDDWGRISILDPRLRTKRYGKAMIAGLPPFGR
jgi:ATP-dependent DNA helicase DinG